MIPLPPGCTVNYSIQLEINDLNEDMIQWFELIGGTVTEKEHWDMRGHRKTQKFVQYGKAKPCHRRLDGTGGVRLHFHGDDASTASVFLIKFNEHVQQHNFTEYMNV